MKKSVLMILSLVMIAVIALTGTIAYLTSTDEDANVMTMGSVKIKQNEQQRVESDGEFTSELESFKQGKVLLPVTYPRNRTTDTVKIGEYEIELSDDEANYVDKIISVTNEGKTDAFVRTIVAVPTGGEAWESTPVAANNCWLHWNIPNGYNEHWTLVSTNVPFVEINGQGYYLWEFVHEAAIEEDETTYPAVRGFYLDKRVNNDENGYFMTYDDGTVKRIDDIAYGDTVDILVVSQAVQADGFDSAETALDAAFGDITATNHPWADGDVEIPVAVATADELTAAFEAGKSVYLTEDITDNRTFEVAENADVTMYLNGHTLTSMDGGDGKNYALSVSDGASLTLKGDGKIVASCYGVSVKPNAKFIMNSGEIVVRGNGIYDYGVVVWNGATFVMNGGKITASADVYASLHEFYKTRSEKQPTVVINDGELIKEKENKDQNDPAYILTDCEPNVAINGGTFDDVEFSGNVSDYVTVDTN